MNDVSDAEELETISDEMSSLGRRIDRLAAKVARGGTNLSPSSRLERAKRIEAIRDMREKYFGADHDLFSDPGFDILLVIYIYELKNKRLGVSAASTAGNSRPTTGLRWVAKLTELQLIERYVDEKDKRRNLLVLTDRGRDIMDAYIDAVPL